MATFICKTEPDTYSFDDLKRDTTTRWDGVSNPQACIYIRQAKKGDQVMIYHTGKERRIVGTATITSAPYEDPAAPGLTAKGDIKRPVFDIKVGKACKHAMTLDEFKADDRFKDFDLVRLSRLSVIPVPSDLDKIIRKNCGL